MKRIDDVMGSKFSTPKDVADAKDEVAETITYIASFINRGRRITDITPASRSYNSPQSPPTSPKIHELLERDRH